MSLVIYTFGIPPTSTDFVGDPIQAFGIDAQVQIPNATTRSHVHGALHIIVAAIVHALNDGEFDIIIIPFFKAS